MIRAASRLGWIGAAFATGIVAISACVGPAGGVGEGDPCTSDDCASNLTCQPIHGRSGDFCCPTPPGTSDKANCQPAATADGG